MLFGYTEEVSAFQIGILTEEMAVLHIPVLSVSSVVDVILANHVRYRIFPKKLGTQAMVYSYFITQTTIPPILTQF